MRRVCDRVWCVFGACLGEQKGFHTPNQRGGGKKHSAALSVRRLFTSSASSSTTSAAVQRASAAHTSFDTVQWADALALFRARKYHLAIASFLVRYCTSECERASESIIWLNASQVPMCQCCCRQ